MLQISVAPSGATAIIRVSGHVEAGDSTSVFSLLNELVVDEYDGAFLDLGSCSDLDSTFIGMLVVLFEKYSRKNGEFYLINVGSRNLRSLQMLGVSTMIPMKELTFDNAPEYVSIELMDFRGDAEQKIEIMELTHRALVAADKQNEERFGSFLRLLESEKSG